MAVILTSVYDMVYSRIMLIVTIDRDIEESVYEQVAGQIRLLIGGGKLEPSTPLPSVRQLAGNLGVNLNTIARAYRLLESEGFLTIRDRAGVVVAEPAMDMDEPQRARLIDQMRTTLFRLRQAGMEVDEMLAIVRHEVLALKRTGQEKDDG